MSDDSAADFFCDQLEALLASPALASVANRHTKSSNDPPEFEASADDRDTEPSVDERILDEQILRDVWRLGLKQ